MAKMTEEQMEEAVERITGKIDDASDSDKMSMEEAIDFLGAVIDHCKTWQRLIQQDIDNLSDED